MAQYTPSSDFTVSSAAYTPSADFDLKTATEVTVGASAVLIRAALRSLGAGAVIQIGRLMEAAGDAVIQQGREAGLDADAVITRQMLAPADANAVLTRGRTLQVGMDAALIDASATETIELGVLASAVLFRAVEKALGSNAVIVRGDSRSVSGSGVVTIRGERTVSCDIDLLPGIRRLILLAGGSACLQAHRLLGCFPDVALIRQNTVERTLSLRVEALIEPGDDMALSFSTGLRNHLLGHYAHETGDGLGGAMHNCFVDVYSGPKPESPDSAPLYGTYLGTFQLSENPYNNEWGGSWTDPQNGRISKQGWQNWVMQAQASGKAGWFRMRLLDDLNHYSQTAHRIDGSIGSEHGLYDLVMRDTNIVEGHSYRIEAFSIMMRVEN